MRARQSRFGWTYFVSTCAVTVLVASGTAGCVAASARSVPPEFAAKPGRGHGPPAHAPAHGFRRNFQRDGVRLQFDDGLGVYVVIDLRDVFFENDRYFRWSAGSWFVSVRPDAGWAAIGADAVPRGLHGYGEDASKGKPGRGRGRGGRR